MNKIQKKVGIVLMSYVLEAVRPKYLSYNFDHAWVTIASGERVAFSSLPPERQVSIKVQVMNRLIKEVLTDLIKKR